MKWRARFQIFVSCLLSFFVISAVHADEVDGRVQERFTAPTLVEYQSGGALFALPTQSPQESTMLQTGQDITLHTEEIGDRRHYQVTHQGKSFSVTVPTTGVGSLVAFDTNRMKFVSLSTSIRLRLTDRVAISEVASSLEATEYWEFEKLGFAIVQLPISTHPVDALEQVKVLYPDIQGYVRLQRPPVRWR